MTFRTISGKLPCKPTTRVNYVTNPSFRATSGTVEVRRNLLENPAFRAASGNIEVRRNYHLDPRGTVINAAGNNTYGWYPRWYGNGSGAGTNSAVTSASDGPIGINSYLRKTWTTSPTSNMDTGWTLTKDNANGLPVTPGEVYTVSVYARTNAAGKTASMVVFYADAAGTTMGSSTRSVGANTALTPNTWVRVSVTATVPDGAAYAAFNFYPAYSNADTSVYAPNDTLDATGALVEKHGSLLAYFDGTTAAANGLTYSWRGTANASASVAQGIPVTTYNGSRAAWWADTGKMWVYSSQVGYFPRAIASAPVAAGDVISVSAKPLDGTGHRVAVQFADASKVALSPPSVYEGTLSNGRISLTTTAPTGAAYASVWLGMSDNAPVGTMVSFENVLCEKAGVAMPYFDGTTAAANGLTYSWSGAANASASVATGPAIKDMYIGNGAKFYDSGNGAILYRPTSSAYTAYTGISDVNSLGLGNVAGKTVTMAFDVPDNIGNITMNITFSGISSKSLVVPTGGRCVLSATIPAGTRSIIFYPMYPGSAYAGNVRISNFMVTIDDNDTTFFDGASFESPTKAYRWSGTANASFSEELTKRPLSILDIDGVTWRTLKELKSRKNVVVNPSFRATDGTVEVYRNRVKNPSGKSSSAAVETRRNLLIDPSSEAGTYSNNNGAYWTLTQDSSKTARGTGFSTRSEIVGNTQYAMSLYARGGPSTTSITVADGEVLTFSGYVYTDAANRRARCRITWWVNGSSVSDTFNWTNLTAGQWNRVTLTATVPSGQGITSCLPEMTVGTVDSSPAPVGEYAWADDFLFEKVGVMFPYFDGSTAAAGDFAYSWTGTANASQSIQTGLGFWGYSGGAAVPITSSDWSADGDNKSLRVVSQYKSAGSAYVELVNDTTAWFSKGKTFTLIATSRLKDKRTLDDVGPAVHFSCTGTQAPTANVTQTAPNVANGVYEHRIVFTIPNAADNTAWRARLYSQARKGDADVWFDKILLVEGEYYGPYFDGSTPADANVGLTYSWDGTANQAESIATGKKILGYSGSVVNGLPVNGIQGPAIGNGFFADMRLSSMWSSPLYGAAVGDYYSAEATVRAVPGYTKTGTTVYIRLHDSIGYVSDYQAVSLPADGTPVRLKTVATSPATNATVRFYVYPSTQSVVRVNDVVVEKVNGPGQGVGKFFDGSTPVYERTNLVKNPSFRNTGSSIEVRRNLCSNPRFQGAGLNGWTSVSANLRRVTVGGEDILEVTQSTTTGTATRQAAIITGTFGAKTYTVSFEVKNSDPVLPQVRVLFYDTNTGQTTGGQPVVQTLSSDGQWHRYTFTSTATIPFNRAYIDLLGTNIPQNTLAYIRKPLMEEASVAMPYFDGTTTASDGLTYSWSGTVDNSESSAIGVRPAGLGFTSNIVAWQGSDGKSLRVLKKDTSSGFLEVSYPFDAQVSPGDFIARSVSVSADSVSVAKISSAYNPSPPATVDGPTVAVGPTPVRLYVTTGAAPSYATSSRMLFTPEMANGGIIYTIRDHIAEKVSSQSETTGAFFDGSTTGPLGKYGWKGSANNSESYYMSPDFTYSWEGTADQSASVATLV